MTTSAASSSDAHRVERPRRRPPRTTRPFHGTSSRITSPAMPWAMAAHRPLGDPIATVATPVAKTSTRATRSFWLVILPAGDRKILRNPVTLPPGKGKCRYNGRYTLPALTDCQSRRACWMRGAHLRGGTGERPVPDHPGRGRAAHGRGPPRHGRALALPGGHAPAPGRGRAPVRRRPRAALRRYPRQRGQPARRGGIALRLRSPAAVADLEPGRPAAHH